MKSVDERTIIAQNYGMTYQEYDLFTDKIVIIYRAIQDAPRIRQKEVYDLIISAADNKLQAAMMGTALICMCKRTPQETEDGCKELFWEVDSG